MPPGGHRLTRKRPWQSVGDHIASSCPTSRWPMTLFRAGRTEAMLLDDSQEHEALAEAARSPQRDPDGGVPSKTAELHAKLAVVAQMDAERLRTEWRRLYRALTS